MNKKKFSVLIALMMCMVLAFAGQAWCGPRDDAVNHAYEVLNYQWYTSGYVLLYSSTFGPQINNGVLTFSSTPYVATGNVRGIPYSLSKSGDGGGDEKTFEAYKNLTMSDKLQKSNRYWYGSSYKVSMRYGMSCATFVTDCILQGMPNNGLYIYPLTNFHKQNIWQNYVTVGSLNDEGYSKLQKGDYLYHQNGDHVRLVVENNKSAKTITYIDQTPPDGTRNGCTNKQYLSNITLSTYNGATYNGPAWKVCMQCSACLANTMGTHKATISYSSLPLYPAYYPMYVNYDGGNPNPEPDTPGINPGLLKLNASTYAKCFTLEDRKYRGGSSGSYSGYLYTDSSLSTLKSYSNWTGKDDEIWLTGVGKNSNGTIWGRISYPVDSSRVTVYVKLQNVLVSDGTITDGEPKRAVNKSGGLYKRRNSGYNSSYWIDPGDTVYLLTEDNGWCQVMYPITGASYWRIAWLEKNDYLKVIGEQLEITKVPDRSVPIVVAGQYFSFQCEANSDVTIWSRGAGTIPSGEESRCEATLPPGLSINSSTGLISGTIGHSSKGKSANLSIVYKFKVNASKFPYSAAKEASIEVWEPPVITTNGTLPNGTLNKPYEQTITAEGTAFGMEWKLKSGSLPPGLELKESSSTRIADRRTVTITGTPTRAGTYTFTLKLSSLVDAPETTTTKTFTITVSGGNDVPDPILYIDYTLKNGKVGQYYSDWVIARGRPSINRATYTGNLPDGMNLVRSGMRIYLRGTPEKSGTFNFTIKAYSDYGYASKNLSVYIAPANNRPFADSSMSYDYGYFIKGKLGVPYSDYDYVRGGTSPYDSSVVKGILPPGLSLSQSGNKIWLRGTPTRYGTYTFTIRALGSHNGYVEKEFTINIADNASYARAGAGEEPDKPTKPKILTTKLPYAAARSMYTVQFEASGTTPVKWSLVNDEIPEGFNLSETGELSGFAAEAGKIKFKVKAENSVGSVTKNITLTVKPQKPAITTQSIYDGVVGEPYTFTFEAEGTEPIKWSKSGSIPSGLKLDSKTGELYGTPKKAGTFTFKVKAKNKGGTDTVQMTMVINTEEPDKTSSVSASSFVQSAVESRSSVNTELFVIADGEETEDDVITDAGQPLTFKIGAWADEAGDEVKVSDVQIYVNDEPVNDVSVAEDGTFTLPGEYVSGEFSVYAKAKHEDSELETSDINVTAEAQDEEISLSDSDSSGSCSINLFGLTGLALCALMAFRKK